MTAQLVRVFLFVRLFFLAADPGVARAQDSPPWTFPCNPEEIANYTAFRAVGPIKVDGVLDEDSWKKAPRSPRFVDLISGKPAIHDTRAALLWDDQNLYVAYWVEEPILRAIYTNKNDPIYYDNDVELFIAGRDGYYELELNGFNTQYEVFFLWNDSYASKGFSKLAEFQPLRMVPFNGVEYTNHPRGGRLGNFIWSYPGLQSAVALDGTLNKDDDRDRGWTVELALPWKGLELLAESEGKSLPPKEGDVWRMDFSRFNTYKAAPPAVDSGGWVWTRHGIWDSHIPECFAKIKFSSKRPP